MTVVDIMVIHYLPTLLSSDSTGGQDIFTVINCRYL